MALRKKNDQLPLSHPQEKSASSLTRPRQKHLEGEHRPPSARPARAEGR
ncbi:unnamed protein product [Penicillium camemberti]|uniref:Str. FM013 n=1 Tax=Penicillium camemberti (strain FM 013) TaxID=1429867 RepID=A0A0G4PUP5_PENC3|nr:unnamed protein product [Penicillium camemberti]